MGDFVLVAGGQGVLVKVAGGRIDGIAAAIEVKWLSLCLADEFLEVLVDIIGGAIAQQLVDLADALQQVGRDVPIEELEVKLVQGLHRERDGFGSRHLKLIYNPPSPAHPNSLVTTTSPALPCFHNNKYE